MTRLLLLFKKPLQVSTCTANRAVVTTSVAAPFHSIWFSSVKISSSTRSTTATTHRFSTSSGSTGGPILPSNQKESAIVNELHDNQKKKQPSSALLLSRRHFSSAATYNDDSDSDDASSSVIPFLLADIGEGIKEVELLQWFVQEGDQVQQFDRVCEVQSDKATVEITSRYDGIVVSLANGGNIGDMIQVGSPLLQIRVADNNDGGSSSSSPDTRSTTSTTSPSSPSAAKQHQGETGGGVLHSQDSSDNQLHIPRVASQFHLDSDDDDSDGFGTTTMMEQSSSGKFLATPAVRKLGMEYNLDLSTLVGTGPQGRVLKADVLTHLRENGQLSASSIISSSSATNKDDNATGISSSPPAQQHQTYLEEDEVVTLRGYNRLMIQTMTASREIPHMGFTDEFDVTKLIECRKDMSKSSTNNNNNTKVSILAFFLKATSLALREYPIINASWKDINEATVNVWSNHNIGVAMDTPRGLVVPVIRNCQNKSLMDIQRDLDELKEIAAAGKLSEEHLRGATFTISNIGSVGGGTYMNPLIVPPQAAIGAMGSMQTLPRFNDKGDVTAAKIINVSWAGDHRIIDGATLARFSNLTKEYLQDPVRMLVSMK